VLGPADDVQECDHHGQHLEVLVRRRVAICECALEHERGDLVPQRFAVLTIRDDDGSRAIAERGGR
jgi:hypothetical protein